MDEREDDMDTTRRCQTTHKDRHSERFEESWQQSHVSASRGKVDRENHPPPDLNVSDLGFFASLRADCGDMETYVLKRHKMMDIIMIKFQEHCSKKFERILASLFNNFRYIIKVRGKNDYKQAHNDGKNRQNRGESPIDLTVDMDDYNECKRLIARFRAQNPA